MFLFLTPILEGVDRTWIAKPYGTVGTPHLRRYHSPGPVTRNDKLFASPPPVKKHGCPAEQLIPPDSNFPQTQPTGSPHQRVFGVGVGKERHRWMGGKPPRPSTRREMMRGWSTKSRHDVGSSG
ncbi:hypothetical protein ZHAS_00004187 [Anopheles sinensis]|uniref:Uncharacterized protein n=1 Tax=Anopheles sinensis TaxID=74873 RepID=A0A084VGB7_ANOSI|nr:hypothetical protein ZHAS_00004187 [Anopheles sinensis]